MPFQRGTSTDYRDLLDKLDKFITTDSVTAVAINAGGTGYVIGDLLTVDGGTVQGSMPARLEVLTLGGSDAIATIRVYDAGAYSVNPSTTANAVTGGSGSGATMDLTMLTADTHLFAVAVNAGGTGYAVDDELTVVGGTETDSKVARITVTAESGGVITAVEVLDAGYYSVNPSTTANAVSGGTGTNATMDLTMVAAQWVQRISFVSPAVDPLVVEGGVIGVDGSSYAVDDVITMVDTATSTVKAQFTVTAVDGGGNVLTINLTNPGSYQNTVGGAQPTTGGSGSGLTITLDFLAITDRWMWEGVGTGSNEVFVGASADYSTTVDQASWLLGGMTGWAEGNDWESQPGLSPVTYMLSSENSMSFWFAANARRIIVVTNVSGSYQSAYLGLLDPYGTEAEIPYPLFICGTSDTKHEDIGSASTWVRGIVDPCKSSSAVDKGPGWFRDGNATWNEVANGRNNGASITQSTTGYGMYPCFNPSTSGLDGADLIAADATPYWNDIIEPDRQGASDVKFLPSPDSSGDLYWPVPGVIMRSDGVGTHKTIGELNGAYWVNAESPLAAEDKITAGNDVFRVFQMGSNSLSYAHFCIIEG